jgi:hypothetical protein
MHFIKLLLVFPLLLCLITPSYAGLKRDEILTTLNGDIEKPFSAPLFTRQCVDGRQAQNFEGEIIEYWVDMNCGWCAIEPIVKAQAKNQDWCIVVRHAASRDVSTSLQKSLTFESLKQQSSGASLLFWENVYPKTGRQLSEKEIHDLFLLLATKLNLDMQKLTDDGVNIAALNVAMDIEVARTEIRSTPTFVISGIRMPACDFSVEELKAAVELAARARQGDVAAKDALHGLIVRKNEE